MAIKRDPPTIADIVVTGLSPVLIMGLVGSLVFFLAEVFYAGRYEGRLLYTLFFFVIGAVLVGRIAVQLDRSRAWAYGIVLACATYLALRLWVEYPKDSTMAPFKDVLNAVLIGVVWSLGVMLYELLTGYMPFDATNPLSLRANISRGNYTNPRILVPGISNKLADIIDRCFKVNPATRITSAGIEQMLGGHAPFGRSGTLAWQMPPRKIMIGAGVLAALVLLVLFFVNNKPGGTREPVTNSTDQPAALNAESRKVMINVPGVENAELITSGNERLPVPYTVTGKDGDQFEFIIHADGYHDKKVQVVISPRRSSFEYNLEKINN